MSVLEANSLTKRLLDGLRVLVMEDEFLIAMDVEQLCLDHGAAEVVLAHSIPAPGSDPFAAAPIHAAILDVRLAGQTTMDFARGLHERGIPFIFATGYFNSGDLFDGESSAFRDVEVVSKPYSGSTLIDALARSIARASASKIA